MPRTKATELDKAAAAAGAAGATKEKKKRRWKPGTVVKRQIRKLQTGKDATKRLIPRAALRRMIKDAVENASSGTPLRTTANSVTALHDGAEDFLVEAFQLANLFAHKLCGKRGIKLRDYQVAAGLIMAKNGGGVSSLPHI